MDDTLLYIAALVVYLIFRGLTSGKKKKKKRVPPPKGSPAPPPVGRPVKTTTGEPTLDDALREIRIALGMEPPPTPPIPRPPSTEPPPTRMPSPSPVAHPTRMHGPELAETAPKKSWSSEFKPIPSHYADSDFEELPTRDGDHFPERRWKPEVRRPTTPPPLPKPSRTTAAKKPLANLPRPKQASTGVRRSRILRQLSDPNAAREAFILSEIFGPPHARRRR